MYLVVSHRPSMSGPVVHQFIRIYKYGVMAEKFAYARIVGKVESYTIEHDVPLEPMGRHSGVCWRSLCLASSAKGFKEFMGR